MKLLILQLGNGKITRAIDFTNGRNAEHVEWVEKQATGNPLLFAFSLHKDNILCKTNAENVEGNTCVYLKKQNNNAEQERNQRVFNFWDSLKFWRNEEQDANVGAEWNEENNTLTIYLTSDEDNKCDDIQTLQLGPGKLSSKFEYRIEGNCDDFNLKIDLDGVVREVHFHICNTVYRSVVDFGSEASQVLIDCGEDVTINNITNLFESIKTRHVSEFQDDKREDCAEYMQYDDSVENLYKSVYYVARRVVMKGNSKNDNAWDILQNRDFFRAITLRDQESVAKLNNGFQRLCNTKIDNLGNVSGQTISVEIENQYLDVPISTYKEGKAYRLALNSILVEILEQVNLSHRLMVGNDRQKCGLKLTVLMPNVYDSNTVATKLTSIRSDVKQIIHEKKLEYIAGVEVNMVSESDASVLGAIATGAIENNGPSTYLVLDCGKGTLDFSIMRYDPDSTPIYRCLCRGGIVGAGNALSYAILYGMVYSFLLYKCSEHVKKKRNGEGIDDNLNTTVKEFIFNEIIGAQDPAEINNLMNAVEQYKRNYEYKKECQNKQDDSQENNAKQGLTKEDFSKFKGTLLGGGINLTIRDFKDFVEKELYRHEDISKFVDAQITLIVFNVVEELNKVMSPAIKQAVDHMLFTGRGFLFGDLRNRMKEEIVDKVFEKRKIDEVGVNCGNLPLATVTKHLCLLISNIINGGAYDGSLVGTCWVTSDMSKNSSVEAGFLLEKFEKKIKSWWKEKGFRSKLLQGNTEYKVDNVIDGAICCRVNYNNNDPIINIGGVEYRLSQANPNLGGKDGFIFYDGTKFKFTVGQSDYDMPNRTILGDGLYTDSLFPYITPRDATQLHTPSKDECNITQLKANKQSDVKEDGMSKSSGNDELKKEESVLVDLKKAWFKFIDKLKSSSKE